MRPAYWIASSIAFLAAFTPLAAGALEPVPELEKQAQAEKLIKDIFKSEYAKTAAADRAALAKKLLAQAGETRNDSSAKFVLLRESRNVAASSGDIKTALRAVDELAKAYIINAPEYRAVAITQAARFVESPEQAVALLEGFLIGVRDDVATEDYAAALRLASLMTTAAAQSRNEHIVTAVRTYIADLRETQRNSRASKPSSPELAQAIPPTIWQAENMFAS